jgi:hypothetical protein
MKIKFSFNSRGKPPTFLDLGPVHGKVADCELHFDAREGAMKGLKLTGFTIWRLRSGAYWVMPPNWQYPKDGVSFKRNRSFSQLMPAAQEQTLDEPLMGYQIPSTHPLVQAILRAFDHFGTKAEFLKQIDPAFQNEIIKKTIESFSKPQKPSGSRGGDRRAVERRKPKLGVNVRHDDQAGHEPKRVRRAKSNE